MNILYMADLAGDLRKTLLTKFSEEELNSLIEEKREEYAYLLNAEGALYALAKELNAVEKTEKVKVASISEIKGNLVGICLKVMVKRIYATKDFEKNGKKGKVCRLMVEDSTGEIPIVLWNDDVTKIETGELEKGDVLTIQNAYSKEDELHLGYDGYIAITKGHTVKKIHEIKDGEIVDIYGKIKGISEIREFQKESKKGKVSSFTLFDETGEIQVVLWDDFADLIKKMKTGDTVKIENGFCKNRDLVVTKESRVLVKPPMLKQVKFSELKEDDLSEISGVIENIVLKEDKLEVDISSDGTVKVSISKELVKNFLNIQNFAPDIGLSTVLELKKPILIGKKVKLEGKLRQNHFIPSKILFV